jgi:hypothetical protein
LHRKLWALAAVALIAAACNRDEPVAAPTVTPTVTEAPPSPTEPPPPPVAALTGVELDEPLDRPVLAVKIDNAAAALPPQGLDAADIVFEEEVEGGLTRFLALFQSEDPEEIGPVRSGREVDADLLPEFDPVLAFSGAAHPVKNLLMEAEVPFYEEGQADDAFFRVPDRIAPHNLFAHTEQLWEAGEDQEVPVDPVFTFDEDTPFGGIETGTADLVFSAYSNAQWVWNDTAWERLQNGSPHVTAEGEVITAQNVVLMRIETAQGNRTDSAGNPTVALDVFGKGPAIVLRDGERFKAQWVKEDADSPLQWLDKDGDPLPLTPGSTWVELLDITADYSFRKVAKKTE